jgi:hypothetical protein
LNLLSSVFVPFEAPVIRPNSYGISPSDVPNRLVATGSFALPFSLTISPVLDVHSGLPYSAVDAVQNYVGTPNSLRFPYYFSLDFQVYRDFSLSRFTVHGRPDNRILHVGVFSIDVTNHQNPHDVLNNVTSPNFGDFVGFERRVDGFFIEVR